MIEVNKQKAKKSAKIAKRIGLVLTAATLLFTVCSDPEKKPQTCDCTNKDHDCNCGKDGCECAVPTCKCDTKLHVGDEECCGIGDCCETVAGTRASNGIAITNRQNIANFNDMVGVVNEALAHALLSTDQKNHIKNNIKEIKVAPTNSESTVTFIEDGVLTVFDGNAMFAIVITLRNWCEAENIAMMFKQFDNSKDNVKLAFAYNGNKHSNCLVCHCA